MYKVCSSRLLAGQEGVSQCYFARSRLTFELRELSRLCCLSVIPWISFTSFEHAMRSPPDSVPRFVFGRHREVGSRRCMPVSIALHHALADGFHAGLFFELFQTELQTARADQGLGSS